jgi:hypothetical protein
MTPGAVKDCANEGHGLSARWKQVSHLASLKVLSSRVCGGDELEEIPDTALLSYRSVILVNSHSSGSYLRHLLGDASLPSAPSAGGQR